MMSVLEVLGKAIVLGIILGLIFIGGQNMWDVYHHLGPVCTSIGGGCQ